jgi:hypothetical protein
MRQYTFISATHEAFSKIDHILEHKAITSCIISDHNRIKLDLNNKRNHKKNQTFKFMETEQHTPE